MTNYPLYLGCTAARHKRLGVHAVVNARGGHPELNDLTDEDIEMRRDADSIARRISGRVRFYGFSSKFFRRRRVALEHLISRYDD